MEFRCAVNAGMYLDTKEQTDAPRRQENFKNSVTKAAEVILDYKREKQYVSRGSLKNVVKLGYCMRAGHTMSTAPGSHTTCYYYNYYNITLSSSLLNIVLLITNTDLVIVWVVCYDMTINVILIKQFAVTQSQFLWMWRVVSHKVTL